MNNKIDAEQSDQHPGKPSKKPAALLPGAVSQQTFDHGGGTAGDDDGDTMTDGEYNNKNDTGEQSVLNRNDGQDRGYETEGAGTGQNPIGETQNQGAREPLDGQFGQEPASERTLRHPKHVEGDPKQQEPHGDGPVGPDVAKHAAKQRTDHSNGGDGDEQSGGEDYCVQYGLASFNQMILTADIADDQGNRGEMAGTEQNADRSPQKTAKAAEKKALAHPAVGGQEQLLHCSVHSQILQLGNN